MKKVTQKQWVTKRGTVAAQIKETKPKASEKKEVKHG